MATPDHDLIIIGGGPAGLTAGLYAARSRLDVVLVERFLPGGQVLNTDWIDNYPGFPEGVAGFALMDKMKEQVDRFELPNVMAEVRRVTPGEDMISVELENDETLTARAMIITTGADPSKLEVEGEMQLTGHGVSYCGTCDGPFYRDQVVAAVGGGDTACEEAAYLTRFAKEVIMIHRRGSLRAQKILQERVLSNEKISMVWDTVVTKIEGHDRVDGVAVRNVNTGEEKMIPVDGVFIWVGTRPNTEFIRETVACDENGFIITDAEMATSVPGIFAAGDCRDKMLRQISTAVGDGATAAYAAEKYIESF